MFRFNPKMCVYCGVDPAGPHHPSYCTFCYYRFQKIGLAFRKHGKRTPSVHEFHRTWNHWRRTPELDAMYLEPIERAA